MVNGEKFQSHAVTLTLIGQCPLSNSSELFSYTTICSSFKLIEPSCTQTDTQTDTQTSMSTLKWRLINRNYNNTSATWKGPSSIHTFQFNVITSESVLKHLLCLPKRSNNDILEFDSKLLKLSAYVIYPYLTCLFNLTFTTIASYC